LLHWGKCGALGRLHIICTWILRSLQRRDSFGDNVEQLLPNSTVSICYLVENVPHGHSDVDALERAFLLCEPLEEFIYTAIREEQQKMAKRGKRQAQDTMKESDPELVKMTELTLDDQDNLKIIHKVLEPFRYWTLHLEGNSTANNRLNRLVADILPGMDKLLHKVEE
jgi:hypothetical protein